MLKKSSDYIIYLLVRLLEGTFSLVTITRLNSISKWLLPLFKRYRKDIVKTQIGATFNSESQRKEVVLAFYQWFTLLVLEILKSGSMSKEELIKRYTFSEIQKIEGKINEGNHAIILLGHCGNWEWCIQSYSAQSKTPCYAIYKPLSNSYLNSRVMALRTKYGAKVITSEEIIPILRDPATPPSIFVMMADQFPKGKRRQLYSFMSRPTLFDMGVEVLQRRYDLSLFYGHTSLMYPSRYDMEVIELDAESETGVTGQYVNQLEKSIKQQPGSWLWSHRRWRME